MSMTTKTIVPALLLVLAVVAAACGDDPRPPIGEPTASPPRSPAATPATSPDAEPAEEVTLQVWFHDGGELVPTIRTRPATPRVGAAAMEALLAGPAADLGTSIPAGTRLLGLTIEDAVAVVDLSEAFASGGGSLSMRMRVAQAVFTLTQFPTVDSVTFEIEGAPVEALGGEGVMLDRPQTREDYEDLLASITVESPAAGDEVSSPLRVAGSANVFEATVQLRLVTREGRVVTETFTTATCGTGCRGTYEEELRFSVAERTEAYLEAYEASAEDGSEINLVRVPIVLLP